MKPRKYDAIVLAPQISPCRQSCKHCWVTHNLERHKPLDEVRNIIDGMAKAFDDPAITEKALLYCLDELTTHPRVTEILAYCRERNVLPQPTLVTNGFGIATRENWQEILSELKECGLNGFLMTVNGDREYHDWFTGSEGSFDRVMEATRRANAHGFRVAWNMYLTRENIDQVVETARMKGDHRIRISVPVHTTKWRQWSHIHADIDVFSRIPEDCQGFVDNDYRSEAEWVELILNGELESAEKEAEGRKDARYKGFFECNDKLYQEVACPGYEVGPMKHVLFRELFASDEVPPGIAKDESMDLRKMAEEHGDPSSATAYCMSGLKRKWSHDSREKSSALEERSVLDQT